MNDSFSFSKEKKITTKAGYATFFKEARCAKKTSFFSVLICKNSNKQTRLGITVGKKRVKQAVKRNRLRRIVRESFRQYQQNLIGLDIVVIIKKNFDGLILDLPNSLFQGIAIKHAR